MSREELAFWRHGAIATVILCFLRYGQSGAKHMHGDHSQSSLLIDEETGLPPFTVSYLCVARTVAVRRRLSARTESRLSARTVQREMKHVRHLISAVRSTAVACCCGQGCSLGSQMQQRNSNFAVQIGFSAADQFPASRFEPRPRARDALLTLSWARSAPVGACWEQPKPRWRHGIGRPLT